MLTSFLRVFIIILWISDLLWHQGAEARAETIDAVVERMSRSYSVVNDYRCILHKKERIKEEIVEQRDIIQKFRKPLSVYMKWTDGVEVLYVEGKYEDKLQVHGVGFGGLLTLSIDPNGFLAMRQNRHTIREAHLGHVVSLILANYEKAKQRHELNASFKGKELAGGTETLLYEAVFPPNQGYYGHVILVNMDRTNGLPVRIRVSGWKKELLEWYEYSDLKLNVGLTDRDFDRDNPEYGFR